MTPETFKQEYPALAAAIAVGACTTIEYHGKAYSFKKIGYGRFESVVTSTTPEKGTHK